MHPLSIRPVPRGWFLRTFTGAESQQRSRLSARAFVAAVVAAILLPTLVVAGWIVSSSVQSERLQLEAGAASVAREVTAAIDREIVGNHQMLLALGSSPALQEGNFEVFYEQASSLARQLGTQIVLADFATRKQLVNTALPWGSSLLEGLPAPWLDRDLDKVRAGEGAVSGVFFGKLVKRNVIAVSVPVFRHGTVEFILSVGCNLGRFADILQSLDLRPDVVIAVLDRRGIIVTRSQKHDQFVGTVVAKPPPDKMQSLVKARNREGIAFHWFNRRSEISGWIVSAGIQDRVLERPAKRALGSFVFAAAALLVVAVAAAYHWGGRLTQSVGALGIDRKPTREEFEVLFDSAPNGVLVVDPDGAIALANARATKKFGYHVGGLSGLPVDRLIPGLLQALPTAQREPPAGDSMDPAMGPKEFAARRKDGSAFPAQVTANPICTRAGNLMMVTVVDITNRKLAQQRISATEAERDDIRRRFMQAQEQERLRLARDLHDQTGQSLTAVMLGLKNVEPLVKAEGLSQVRRLNEQMVDMGKSLHRIAWELRPASLDELGLEMSLSNYAGQWQAQYGIEVDFHCSARGLESLPDETRTTIYRIVQEGLTNIARHARQAKVASIAIERVASGLWLTIEDNGSRFDVRAKDKSSGGTSGLGLAGMAERVSLIGGTLEVTSSPGRGTTIFAWLPLEPERIVA